MLNADLPKHCGGVVAVVVTPCRAVGQVDRPAMTRLCQILSAKGCHGLFVLGSTGELPLLDERDRRTLTAAARQGSPSETRLYVGVSGSGWKQAIRYARYAARDGADLAVVMAPFFLRFSQTELVDYVRAIADASPIPVAIYHHLRMPTQFGIDCVARLAEHPNVAAMKDSSQDLARIGELVAVLRDTGTVLLQGSEPLIHQSLQAGAGGCVTALAGVAPEWHVALYRAHCEGDATTAADLQKRISQLWKMFGLEPVRESFSNFAYTLKRTLAMRGWLEQTEGMMPGFQPDEGFEQAILDHLRTAGLCEKRE